MCWKQATVYFLQYHKVIYRLMVNTSDGVLSHAQQNLTKHIRHSWGKKNLKDKAGTFCTFVIINKFCKNKKTNNVLVYLSILPDFPKLWLSTPNKQHTVTPVFITATFWTDNNSFWCSCCNQGICSPRQSKYAYSCELWNANLHRSKKSLQCWGKGQPQEFRWDAVILLVVSHHPA